MREILATVLAALTMGCASAPEYYIDTHKALPHSGTWTYSVGSGVNRGAVAGATRMLAVLGLEFRELAPNTRGDIRIEVALPTLPYCIENTNIVAFAYPTRREIYLCPKYQGKPQEHAHTYAHEIGHVLGLGHLPDGQEGVFAEYVYEKALEDLTVADVQFWRECTYCSK